MAQLQDKGVFLVRGAVELVATRLNISKFALYGDIEQARKSDPISGPEASSTGSAATAPEGDR